MYVTSETKEFTGETNFIMKLDILVLTFRNCECNRRLLLLSGLQNVLRAIYGPLNYLEKTGDKSCDHAGTGLLSDELGTEVIESSAAVTVYNTDMSIGEIQSEQIQLLDPVTGELTLW